MRSALKIEQFSNDQLLKLRTTFKNSVICPAVKHKTKDHLSIEFSKRRKETICSIFQGFQDIASKISLVLKKSEQLVALSLITGTVSTDTVYYIFEFHQNQRSTNVDDH